MNKNNKRLIRHLKIRKRVIGSEKKPRVSVYRSNKNIFVQLIDDTLGKTLVSASTMKIKEAENAKSQNSKKLTRAEKVGEALAKDAIKKNVKKIVFDRGGYKYHGRVKALAEGLRKGGLEF